MRNNRIKENCLAVISSGLLAFSVMFIAALFLSIISWGNRESNIFPFLTLIAMFLSSITVIGSYALYLRKKYGLSLLEEIGLKNKLRFKYLIASILAVAIILIVIIIFTVLFPAPSGSYNETTRTLTTYNGPFPFFVGVLYPVTFAPIIEETLYRGIVGKYFNIFKTDSKVNKVLFIITSTLVFGYLHLQDSGTTYSILTSFLFPAVSSLIFSFEYLKTKNIIYPMITHGLYNMIILMITMAA